MKISDKNSFTASLRNRIRLFREGVFSLFSGKEKDFFLDFSHIQHKEEGSKMHFLYVLFFALCAIAALWQHSTATFTFATLFLLIPVTFILFIPYKFADILFRQMVCCGIFFCACFWITYRIKHAVPFDLALTEGLIAGSFAFFISCTAKDYHYLFFAGAFLLIYAGLVPRKILLYLAPGVFFLIPLILAGERKTYLAGEKILKKSPDYSPWRSFFRVWHIFLLQILLAIPIFVYVFSLVPLHDTGQEGYFEVSFMTSRTSALPPDLQKWLKQGKKVTPDRKGEFLVKGDTKADVSADSGKKDLSGDLPGSADGNGKGSSPGKDLVFTVSLPVKLYHLATLYDEYDGKKWHTSTSLLKNITKDHIGKSIYTFSIRGKYTIHKWVSHNLYTPYRFTDIQSSHTESAYDFLTPQWHKYMRKLKTNSFQVKFSETAELPALPFQYAVTSVLAIPILSSGRDNGEKEGKSEEETKKKPSLYSSAESLFSHQKEEERERRQEAMKKADEAKVKGQKAIVPQKKKTFFSAYSPPEKPRILRYAPAFSVTPRVTKYQNSLHIPKILEKDPYRPARPAVIKYSPRRPVYNPYYRKKFDPAWRESLSKSHFLRLPQDLSPRIAGLAKTLTKELHTPYEKAIALRDHLRKNYKYKLYAYPVPEDKESIEYFLFELQEGHCEYFASALTVLARSCGLPARVATGFSPGNYNALTKLFEVHEYHAHAWSQIYIDQVGWLTFDAVPPGNIVSDTLPAGLGLLRDPFGQDWKITPPELTESTLGYVKNTLFKEALKEKSEEMQKAVSQMIRNDEALKSQKTEKAGKNIQNTKKKSANEKGVWQRMKSFFLYFTGRTGEKFLALLSTSDGRTFLISLCIFLGALFFFFRDILAWAKLLYFRYKFGKLFAQSANKKYDSAETELLCLYRALRLLLLLAGMKRINNQELLAYGSDTEKYYFDAWKKRKEAPEESLLHFREKSILFSTCIRNIFQAFYVLEYGQSSFTEKEISQYRKDIIQIFSLLRQLYPDGFFFLEKLIFADPFPNEDEKEDFTV